METRHYLYLDIETAGVDPTDEERVALYRSCLRPPRNMSKPDTIQAWRDAPERLDEAALKGLWGQVVAWGIGWRDGDAHAFIGKNQTDTLAYLACNIEAAVSQLNGRWPILVGHNLTGFDLRYLWQRAVALGVQLPTGFPYDAQPWNDRVDDTMFMWGGRNGYVSLAELAAGLGIPVDDAVSGADVPALWRAGAYDAIRAHVESDVRLVREVHQRMLAVDSRFGPLAQQPAMAGGG